MQYNTFLKVSVIVLIILALWALSIMLKGCTPLPKILTKRECTCYDPQSGHFFIKDNRLFFELQECGPSGSDYGQWEMDLPEVPEETTI